MLEKLMHKKWMALCLLIGNILLISITASLSLYRDASYRRMLIEEFEQSAEETGRWPMNLRVEIEKKQYKDLNADMDTKLSRVEQTNVPLVNRVDWVSFPENLATLVIPREEVDKLTIALGYITDLENNIEIVAGRMYSDEVGSDGVIEVIISEAACDRLGVLLDEEIAFANICRRNKTEGGYQGDALKVRVVGVFRPKEGSIPYWNDEEVTYAKSMFMPKEVFEDSFVSEALEADTEFETPSYIYKAKIDYFFDYTKVNSDDIAKIKNVTNTFMDKTKWDYGEYVKEPSYSKVFDTFKEKEKKINATLIILQVPCLILLCAFIYMISEQMLRMEQNEISMLKSRGSTKWQIIGLYFMQSCVIAGIAYVISIPVSMLICSFLGSARAFLQFDIRYALSTRLTGESLLYGLAAFILSIVVTVVPVIKHSDVSIVNAKRQNNAMKKNLWQKFYFDVILLAISIYGYYSFSRSSENIKEQIISGKGLDPFLYFCATLFILGAGMLFMRLWPYAINLLYKVKKKKISSAGYVSFLSTIRSMHKQQFIMIFMILTVALGIFYVTIARTIISNAQKNLKYVGGSDVVLEEKWNDNSAFVGSANLSLVTYYEPNYGRFSDIEGVESITQVIDDEAKIWQGETLVMNTRMLAIKTKEFGEMTELDNELLPYSYHTYLNTLAKSPNGVLVSANARKQYGVNIGDILYVTVKDRPVTLQVIGFFDYWPSYKPVTYLVDDSGKLTKQENYLLVSNYSYVRKRIGNTPYRVWMKFTGDTSGFYNFVDENDINVKSYVDTIKESENVKNDTLFQGTNGILSLSFIVIIALCGVGYLIYWIMSIRSRELLFGILRAMGMNKSEIIHILANEQIFCGISSVFAGVGIGTLASIMYVPMIQNAYAATNQIMPLELVCGVGDLLKLFIVILLVLVVCMVVLAKIIAGTNISSALKLGED